LNTTTGDCVRTLDGHTGYIEAIKVMNDQLFSCSNDCHIKIWDLTTYRLIKTISAHHHSVDSIEIISLDRVISGSYDETIKIWDTKTGKALKTLEGNSESFQCLKLISDDQLISCSIGKFPEINSIKIWDLKSGKCAKNIVGHKAAVNYIDFLPAP